VNGLDHLSPFLEGRPPPDAPMSLRCNPRHVLLPCEVATVVDGEVVEDVVAGFLRIDGMASYLDAKWRQLSF
jgi:hypothetical protein